MHHAGLLSHELVVRQLAYIQQMYSRVLCMICFFYLAYRVAKLQQWIWGFVSQRALFDLEEHLDLRLGVCPDGE